MRRFFSFIIAFIYIAVFVISPVVSAQGTNNGDVATTAPAFELIFPGTVKVNEAFDVTVKALNQDGSANTKYEGAIYFSVTPGGSGATIPADFDGSGVEYKFQLSEQGQHTFSKAFTFPKDGKYDILVGDYESFAEVTKPITVSPAG
jgi:hypothetical protein